MRSFKRHVQTIDTVVDNINAVARFAQALAQVRRELDLVLNEQDFHNGAFEDSDGLMDCKLGISLPMGYRERVDRRAT